MDLEYIGKQVAASTAVGALVGLVSAEILARNKPSTMFTVASKYCMVSIPFFTLRSSMLKSTTLYTRDIDELKASVTAGIGTGSLTGLLWRGPLGVVPIALFMGTTAGGIQFMINQVRHWRIKRSIERMNSASDEKVHTKWNESAFQAKDIWDGTLTQREGFTFDPIKRSLDIFKDTVFDFIFDGEVPTYFSKATDIEYRKKLLLKIGILNSQIHDLKEQLRNQNDS